MQITSLRGARRFSGVDELLLAVVEQARIDLTYQKRGENPYCVTDHVGEDDEVANKQSSSHREPYLLDPRWSIDGEPRPHRIGECAKALIDELVEAVERKEDPQGKLLEIVSR